MSSRLGRELLKLKENHPNVALRLSGLSAPARAYACAALITELRFQKKEDRLLIVCSDSDQAVFLHQALKTFLGVLGFDRASELDYLPGWEHSPYRGINPNVKSRLRRLRALYRVAMGETAILVTDARSLAQKTLAVERLVDSVKSIAAGDYIDREALRTTFEKIGYRHSDPVEDAGSYCFRGNILDFFSPYHLEPVRIEFFGDEVETLRFFDADSQRTKKDTLSSATIIPALDWISDEDTAESALSKIKSFCDEHEIPKKTRDEMSLKFQAGVREPSFDYLLPYLEKHKLETISEYLSFSGKKWIVLICDEIGIQTELDRLKEELVTGFTKSIENNLVVAPPDHLYDHDVTRALQISERAIFLNPFQIGVLESREDVEATDDRLSAVMALANNAIIPLRENSDFRSSSGHAIEAFLKKSEAWSERSYVQLIVASSKTQAERIVFLLSQKKLSANIVNRIDFKNTKEIQVYVGNLSSGFRLPFDNLAVVTDSEIFGPKKQRVSSSQQKTSISTDALATFIPSLEEIRAGELLVHQKHGIGRYQGLVKLEIEKIPQDFLLVEYAGGDKLYIPIYRLEQVQRYIGDSESSLVALDKLGASQFQKTKEKVREALKELAHELLRIYALRASNTGFQFGPPDESFKEFEAKFPFAETPDQLRAIDETLSDMQSGKVMDRLICGDVGYGKTEVAMRAAYRAILDRKQVGVLVPTTVLALQHELSFKNRFKDTGVRIASISRFKSAKEVKDILAEVKEGKIDILIGTHRLLSRDIAFKDLGLIVVDEEQRFGVEHKEKLKKLKVTTAVLTLTATPIPRTLHMSLMGMRDISVINTAPVDRLSVRTYISRFEEEAIRSAISQEIARGGQVFFIHNRVQSIAAMEDRLKKIVPTARIVVAHGQLRESELEEKMLEFYDKKADVLLCTTIIESGLDIPSANTIIINRADTFGLAQLYQLRGRVGRSQVRAYCYLLLPEEGLITDEAKKRLEVIQRFVDLGSGFKVASHDLELRGGGDLLGKAQSGHIAAVGYELYTDLLEETIHELKGEKTEERFEPEIRLPVAALLPDDYVPDIQQRLGLYKRLSQADTVDKIADLEAELVERFGTMPDAVKNLLELIQIKQLLVHYRIKTLLVGHDRISLDCSDGAKLSPDKVLSAVKRSPKELSVTPESKLILRKNFEGTKALLDDLRRILTQVGDAA